MKVSPLKINLLLPLCLSACLGLSCSTESAAPLEDPSQNPLEDRDLVEASTPGFVTKEEARAVADAFFRNLPGGSALRGGAESSAAPVLAGEDIDYPAFGAEGEVPAFYVFDLPGKGFVLVSANEGAYPILGYSLESDFPDTDTRIPEHVAGWFAGYRRQIEAFRKSGAEPSAEMRSLRGSVDPVGEVVVAPLLGRMMWDQWPYYNDYCPPGTPVGCVATAASQIMRYWEYPKRSVGTHGYYWPPYGNLYADFNHEIDWKAMPDTMVVEPNHEVARFCYEVGVALEMQYDPWGSGAYSSNVDDVLRKYYGYPYAEYHYRGTEFDGQNVELWHRMLQDDLLSGRPVYYSGADGWSGHAFVFDGFDSENYYHVNWGWSGASNGWFLIDALNPWDLGTGAGSGGYNSGQEMVLGIYPPNDFEEGDNRDASGDNAGDADMPFYPAVTVTKADYLYIARAALNGMDHPTGSDGFSYNEDKEVLVGSDNLLGYELTVRYILFPENGYLKGWIDADRNGRFDDTEVVLEGETGGGETVSGTADLSSLLTTPGRYRLRIALSLDPITSGDGAVYAGEVEDYPLTKE